VTAHVELALEQGDVLDLTGQEITIQLLSAPTMAVGYVGYFFTNAGLVGQTVEVLEVAHADPGVFPTVEADVPGIEAMLADQRLYERAQGAASVVAGQVTAIAPHTGPVYSEHDPMWAVATLQVDCAMQGATPAEAHLAFPTSDDIMWHQSPKLTLGQTGVFLMQPLPLPASDYGIPAAAEYEIDQPLDVQPATDRVRLATLLRCEPWPS
jgi:hypothetical protein